jgi:phosphatidylinositol alpha-1,6-mannosyltransferase
MKSEVSVLALVTDAFGGKGGVAQYNRDLLEAWSGSAFVTILPRAGAAAGVHGPRIRQLAPTDQRVGYTLRALYLAVVARPDVVFCGHLYMAPVAWLAARIARAKLVVQVHGIDAWDDPGRWRRLAVGRSDLVLSVSRYTRLQLLSWATLEPQRVKVLPNTVGEHFTPGDREAARRSFGFGRETVLLSVGRLDPREQYKGQDRVIRVLPGLLREHPGLLYCIAGEGDDRARLEALARHQGVSDNVRFLGPVADANMPDLYRAADVFTLPSTGEGFGIVFLEAMACGTPALGLNSAGAADALADGRLGRACTEYSLAQDLKALLAHPPPDSGQRTALAMRIVHLFGRDAFCTRARKLLETQAA